MAVRRAWLHLAISLLYWPAFAFAGSTDCVKPKVISLHGNGAAATTVTGGIIRAESICYVLDLSKGRRLKIDLKSLESNVVVTVYTPGYEIRSSSEGPDFVGKTLAQASETTDATRVVAHVPSSGAYLLVLDTKRGGGAEYRMRVAIR